MKLNIVPARTGIQWVKSGVITFFRQPLAMAGLFFMFMAVMSVLSFVPVVGSALALALLPAATLGLMAGTREAAAGKFPRPMVLAVALRGSTPQKRAMLALGLMYAACFLAVMALSALLDGGKFASLYLGGGGVTRDMAQDGDFLTALWASMALYLPVSMLFWHAPALVHWHGLAPAKSLFFSFVACLRNAGAFIVYGLVWLAVFLVAGLVVSMLAGLAGGPGLAATLMFPVAMLLAAMFFTSIHFTVQDCFETSPGDTA
jgi:hypothetical protein